MSAISGVGNASSAWSQISSSSDRRQRLFEKADTNGDGTVDATELQGFLDKGAERTGGTAPNAADLMKSADTDGSGGLDVDEFDAGLKSLAPAAGSTVEFAHHRGGMHGGPKPSDDDDASSTGTSATSDLTKSLQDLFQAADTNGDGSLDGSELATLKTNIDTAIQSLESGGSSATAASTDTTTASSGSASASGSSSTTGSSSTDAAQATWLDLTQLVLKEYASNAAASSSSDQATAISLTA